MSTDWQEKEREFLTSLKANTGRDLGEWMRVIAAQNLPHRNDIIDWLRQQGFPFARASWLERIHHNQGRPIYLDPAELTPNAAPIEAEAEGALQRVAAGGSRTVFVAAPTTADAPPRQPPTPARSVPLPRIAAETPRPAAPRSEPGADAPDNLATGPVADARSVSGGEDDPSAADVTLQSQSSLPSARSAPSPEAAQAVGAVTPPPHRGQTTDGQTGNGQTADGQTPEIEDVLARAKAYRPLAMHLLRMIKGAVPDLEIAPGPSHLLLSRGNAAFALIAVSGRDIRLALRLGSQVACAPLGPVKLPVTLARAAHAMTHMAVLTDARQLDASLIDLVRRAARG